MRFASRVSLFSSIFVVPAAFTAYAGGCTSFPDLVDVGAGDGSLTAADSGPPTMIVTEADGNMVVTLLDGAAVPDSGSGTTGGDRDTGTNPVGDDDSGMTTTDDAGMMPPPVDGGPMGGPKGKSCTGSIDCSLSANKDCYGCSICAASGCTLCNPGVPGGLASTCGTHPTLDGQKATPCCAHMNMGECAPGLAYTCPAD